MLAHIHAPPEGEYYTLMHINDTRWSEMNFRGNCESPLNNLKEVRQYVNELFNHGKIADRNLTKGNVFN